jgi:hypothetical protein
MRTHRAIHLSIGTRVQKRRNGAAHQHRRRRSLPGGHATIIHRRRMKHQRCWSMFLPYGIARIALGYGHRRQAISISIPAKPDVRFICGMLRLVFLLFVGSAALLRANAAAAATTPTKAAVTRAPTKPRVCLCGGDPHCAGFGGGGFDIQGNPGPLAPPPSPPPLQTNVARRPMDDGRVSYPSNEGDGPGASVRASDTRVHEVAAHASWEAEVTVTIASISPMQRSHPSVLAKRKLSSCLSLADVNGHCRRA